LFTDLELSPGDIWHEKIQGRIRQCDVLICLLTDGFFVSSYIQNEEYGRIKEKNDGLIHDLAK